MATRWPRRRGFGIQSPSDFFFVTSVVYEALPYYAYRELQSKPCRVGAHYATRTHRLLFRVANYLQPDNFLEVGGGNGMSAAYIQAACRHIRPYRAGQSIGFLHIGHTDAYREAYEQYVKYVNDKSCFVIGHIHGDANRRAFWRQVVRDPRTRVCFDVFDLGIVFFDTRRYKQYYKV